MMHDQQNPAFRLTTQIPLKWPKNSSANDTLELVHRHNEWLLKVCESLANVHLIVMLMIKELNSLFGYLNMQRLVCFWRRSGVNNVKCEYEMAIAMVLLCDYVL